MKDLSNKSPVGTVFKFPKHIGEYGIDIIESNLTKIKLSL